MDLYPTFGSFLLPFASRAIRMARKVSLPGLAFVWVFFVSSFSTAAFGAFSTRYPLSGSYKVLEPWLQDGNDIHDHSHHYVALMSTPIELQRHILLSKEHIDTATEPALQNVPSHSGAFWIHLQGPIHHETVNDLERISGSVFDHYYPQNTYLIWCNPKGIEALLNDSRVKWIGEYSHSIGHSIQEVEDALQIIQSTENSVVLDPVHSRAHSLLKGGVNSMVVTVISGSLSSLENEVYSHWTSVWPDIVFIPHSNSYVDVTGIPHELMSEFSIWASELGYVLSIEAGTNEMTFASPGQEGVDYRRYTTQARLIGEHNTRREASTPVWDMGIHGEGQVIHITDDGVVQDHCAYSDKIVAYNYVDGTSADNNHGGVHASTAVGKDPDGLYHGTAYEAKLSVADTDSTGWVTSKTRTTLNFGKDNGAFIFTNSFGIGELAEYSAYTRVIDEWTSENPSNLVLYAAGNTGSGGTSAYNNLAVAKNVIGVGNSNAASEQFLDMCFVPGNFPTTCFTGVDQTNRITTEEADYQSYRGLSGRGPGPNGRIAPTVMAPGIGLAPSPGTTCDFDIGTGTSMSCPVASGAAALVRQWLVEGWYPGGEKGKGDELLEPPAALLKALLVNSAEKLTGGVQEPFAADAVSKMASTLGRYSEFYGFGAVRIGNVVFDKDTTAGTDIIAPGLTYPDHAEAPSSISTGEEVERCFTIEAGTRLAVTLAWTDKPGETNNGGALVNNLDLVVKGQGQTLIGNELSQWSDGTADTVNSVEKVEIEEPEAGRYCATVLGTNVPEGPQSFALVISGGGQDLGRKDGANLTWLWMSLAGIGVVCGLSFAAVVMKRQRDAGATGGAYVAKPAAYPEDIPAEEDGLMIAGGAAPTGTDTPGARPSEASVGSRGSRRAGSSGSKREGGGGGGGGGGVFPAAFCGVCGFAFGESSSDTSCPDCAEPRGVTRQKSKASKGGRRRPSGGSNRSRGGSGGRRPTKGSKGSKSGGSNRKRRSTGGKGTLI